MLIILNISFCAFKDYRLYPAGMARRYGIAWCDLMAGPICKGMLLKPVSQSSAQSRLVLAGHLEQSLASALRTYAPPYESDTDAEEAQEPQGAAPEAPRTAVERHAELTQRAERLLREEGPLPQTCACTT